MQLEVIACAEQVNFARKTVTHFCTLEAANGAVFDATIPKEAYDLLMSDTVHSRPYTHAVDAAIPGQDTTMIFGGEASNAVAETAPQEPKVAPHVAKDEWGYPIVPNHEEPVTLQDPDAEEVPSF